MSTKDFVCLIVFAFGVVLFMYGANYFDGVTGWAGVFMIFAGVICAIIVKLYEDMTKKRGRLEAVEL